MLGRFKAAGLVWATVFALMALAVLLGLGTWQMQRKAWKDGLLASISQRLAAAPVALPLGKLTPSLRLDEYARVEIQGTFAHEREQYFYAPDPRLGPGYHVYTPLVLDISFSIGTGDQHHHCSPFVIVNRGFVPEQFKSPQSRSGGQVEAANDTTKVVGLVRPPQRPGSFTPANQPGKNMWYWRDVEAMAQAMMASGAGLCGALLPFFIDAEAAPANPGGWPKGGTTNLDIPNRHLEYALTWYGLALTLIGVFVAFACGRLKQADS